MSQSLIVQGRRLDRPELENLRQWVGEHPDWSRRHLSLELASRWDWRNRAGQLKDMAARTLLLKLHQRGLLELPARRQAPTNRMRCVAAELALPEESPEAIGCALEEMGPLQVKEVSRDAAERAWGQRGAASIPLSGIQRRRRGEPAVRRFRCPRPSLSLPGLWSSRLEVPGT